MDPLVIEAERFATWAHGSIDQRRKYTNEPYIVHPREVASIVSTVEHTPVMLAASWLHDTIEDVPHVTYEILLVEFGAEVANLVNELTDKSTKADGTRRQRKEIDRLNLMRASAPAQTVKLADLLSNTRSIVQYDQGFARTYVQEKALLLAVLTKGDSKLLGDAFKVLMEAGQQLRLDIFELAAR